MSVHSAILILNHLMQNNLGFCYLQSTGEIVSREMCEAVISRGE